MNIYHSKLCLILTLLNLHIYSYLFRRFDWSTSVHDYTSIYNRKNSLLHYNAHASVILSTHQGILWGKYMELASREERVHHKLLLLIWMPGGHWNCDTFVEFEHNQAWKEKTRSILEWEKNGKVEYQGQTKTQCTVSITTHLQMVLLWDLILHGLIWSTQAMAWKQKKIISPVDLLVTSRKVGCKC